MSAPHHHHPTAVPAWFHNAVVSGVQLLHALNLQGCPSAETVVLTAQAWIEALWGAPIAWDLAADEPRLAGAFRALSRQAERWPAPGAVLALLPPRPDALRLAPPAGTPPPREIAERLQDARAFFHRKAQP